MITLQTINKNPPKKETYQLLLEQIKAITASEKNLIANLANISSILKYEMNWFWVGVYLVKEGELVLGPFQGPVACTRIKKGNGVCGSCWEENKTITVPNVDLFEGHIACSSNSKSEIVIPIQNNKRECIGVLDIDSEYLNSFDEEDKTGLELIVNYINKLF